MIELEYRSQSHPAFAAPCPERRTVASYEYELAKHRRIEIQLREIIAEDEGLLRAKDELIRNQDLLSKESNHRLLNDLQLIVSLLSLQSRASANAEVAAQLAGAADRIIMIGRIHRCLHRCDGVQTVALKQFLDDLCGDLSRMLSSERAIVVEGIEIDLPAVTAGPLGFIVNELITNAAKHGKGRITVSLQPDPDKSYALSISNDGRMLPEAFDPAASRGMGMRIIRSFIERIGGELRIDRGDNSRGARFAVLFSDGVQTAADRASGCARMTLK
jgi:two-component sensor histidine kinase